MYLALRSRYNMTCFMNTNFCFILMTFDVSGDGPGLNIICCRKCQKKQFVIWLTKQNRSRNIKGVLKDNVLWIQKKKLSWSTD